MCCTYALTGGIDLRNVCAITTYATSEDTVVSELAILDFSYFTNTTVFNCIGYNGVQNYINSPENDSVELVLICKQVHAYIHTRTLHGTPN